MPLKFPILKQDLLAKNQHLSVIFDGGGKEKVPTGSWAMSIEFGYEKKQQQKSLNQLLLKYHS